MQISSRVELHFSSHPNKVEHISLAVFENAVTMDSKVLGETVEQAIDTLDTLQRELLKMQAGFAASLRFEKRTPTCSCAELNRKSGGKELAACSRCVMALPTDGGPAVELPHAKALPDLMGCAGINPPR